MPGVHFSCGFNGIFGPGEFFEPCLFDWLVALHAQAVGAVCDPIERFIDLVNEFTIGGCEFEVQTLLEAFCAELGGVACGLGFTGV